MEQYRLHCTENIDISIAILERMGIKNIIPVKEPPYDVAVLYLSKKQEGFRKNYDFMKRFFIRNHIPFLVIYI